MVSSVTHTPSRAKKFFVKVPEITLYFWIIKLLTTAMGEATSDFLVYSINPYVAVVLGFVGFVISLVLQFSVKRYIAWVYWLMVVMVSIFGTMAADVTHIVLGVPYYLSTMVFLIVLIAVFMLWYRVEGTLSIHSIHTRRREIFYWATVLATFALGTAAGDMTAMTLHLGYFASGIFFAVVFFIPAFGYWRLRWNSIFSFWFAYIFTRPLGASFADWFGMPTTSGGLGDGKGVVSLILTVVIIALVVYLSITKADIQQPSVEPRQA